jgi:hypothetical protein
LSFSKSRNVLKHIYFSCTRSVHCFTRSFYKIYLIILYFINLYFFSHSPSLALWCNLLNNLLSLYAQHYCIAFEHTLFYAHTEENRKRLRERSSYRATKKIRKNFNGNVFCACKISLCEWICRVWEKVYTIIVICINLKRKFDLNVSSSSSQFHRQVCVQILEKIFAPKNLTTRNFNFKAIFSLSSQKASHSLPEKLISL